MAEMQTKMAHVDGNDTGQQVEMQNKGTSIAAISQAELFSAAQRYHAAGHNVIWWRDDTDPKKQWPRWSQWQKKRQTEQELADLFNKKPYHRIAIICTDGMEAIDIDIKADPSGTIIDSFINLVCKDEVANRAFAAAVVVKTKSGGMHVVYRAANAQGNQKLAHRDGSKEAVIETRGPGGLIFVTPSPGYELREGDYTDLPTLTNEQRDALIKIARLLNEPDEQDTSPSVARLLNEPDEQDTSPSVVSGCASNADDQTPWAAYNDRHTVDELASRYGWRVVYNAGNKLYLNRPGAKNTNGVDAVILITNKGNRRMYVHSTSTGLETGKCLSPFDLYVTEEHRGDLKAAAKALLAQGYGQSAHTKNRPERRHTYVGQSAKPDEESPEFFCKNLKIKDGRYYWEVTKEVRGTWVVTEMDISNFTVRPLYHLADPRCAKRVFEIANVHGKTAVLCVPTKELATVAGFQAAVEAVGGFVASFSPRQYAALKEWWFDNEQAAIEVAALGYLPGTNLYAFANGIFDGTTWHQVNDFGIVEVSGVQYFIPVFSSIYKGDEALFQHERKFCHSPASTVTFERWGSLFCRAFSENDNGMVGTMFVCAAAFRTVIAAHTNFFPLLFLFGMKGTGKSTFRDALLSLFGQPQDAISLGSASSPKGFNRRLGQRRDAVMVFEEYKNSIPPQLIEMLKSVYDLIGYERAQTTNDNRTHHTPVLSAVVVAGQELPVKENALFSRTVTVEFLKTTFSDDQTAAYNELADLQKGAGVTAATLELLRTRPHIERDFVAAYREMCVWLKEHKAPADLSAEALATDCRLPHTVDERSINNTAVLMAMYRILSKHLVFPFTLTQLFDTLVSKLKVQVEIMSKTTEVSQFWNAFEVLVSQHKISEGRDYKLEQRDNERWVYFYPTTVFSAYTEYQRRVGGHALDDATLTRYLKRQPGFRPGKDRNDHLMRLANENVTPSTTPKRCLAFDILSTGINF